MDSSYCQFCWPSLDPGLRCVNVTVTVTVTVTVNVKVTVTVTVRITVTVTVTVRITVTVTVKVIVTIQVSVSYCQSVIKLLIIYLLFRSTPLIGFSSIMRVMALML